MTLLDDLGTYYSELADEGEKVLARLATEAGASDRLLDLVTRICASLFMLALAIIGAVLISPLALAAVIDRIVKRCK